MNYNQIENKRINNKLKNNLNKVLKPKNAPANVIDMARLFIYYLSQYKVNSKVIDL